MITCFEASISCSLTFTMFRRSWQFVIFKKYVLWYNFTCLLLTQSDASKLNNKWRKENSFRYEISVKIKVKDSTNFLIWQSHSIYRIWSNSSSFPVHFVSWLCSMSTSADQRVNIIHPRGTEDGSNFNLGFPKTATHIKCYTY